MSQINCCVILFYSYGNVRIVIDSTNSTVVIQFPDRITLIIMRHLKPKSLLRAGKVHLLGFYIMNFKGISPDVHGLLGMLTCPIISKVFQRCDTNER